MNDVKKYDVVVLGNGSGAEIVETALIHDATVALIDQPPIGGTCQNFGCIPSKMLIFPADQIVALKNFEKLGIKADISQIDFQFIMKRMRNVRKQSQDYEKRGINQVQNLNYYQGNAFFIDNETLQVNDTMIKGEKFFIGTGARPLIPPIKGLEKVDYLTNESLLDLKHRPESLIIIGGGYVAVEYAHFFSAMGTKVTILQKSDRLIPNEEPEISDLLKDELSQRMDVLTNIEAIEVKNSNDSVQVIGKHVTKGSKQTLVAKRVLLAAGRTSNADMLKINKTGIDLDKKGYIKVNEYMETNQPNFWAFGDATGKHMFKHVANEEASIAGNNGFHGEKIKMRYHAVPHAVFSYPQIASVGFTQKEAAKKGYDLLVGKAHYDDVAKGDAMAESKGFAKAIVNKKDFSILGFHIIGPYAPMIIQEVVTIMEIGGKLGHIGLAMHIHPSLSELIQKTLASIEEV